MFRKLAIACGLTFSAVFLAVFLLANFNLEAQSGDPLPLPESGNATAIPEVQTFFANLETKAYELQNRDLTSYRVLYLTSTTSDTGEKIADLGITVVNNWDDVINQHASSPLQLLMIDVSVVGQVDKTWLQNVYYHGTAIVGIGITIPEMIELTGDQCTLNPKAPLRYGEDVNFFNLYAFGVVFDYEVDLPLVVSAELNDCSDEAVAGLTGGYYHTGFGYNAPLATAEDYERLVYWLKQGAANLEVVNLKRQANTEYSSLIASQESD